MVTNDLGYGLRHFRYESWVLKLPYWRVVRCGDLFELMVSVELDIPSQLLQLCQETSLDDMDGPLIYAYSRLSPTEWTSYDSDGLRVR